MNWYELSQSPLEDILAWAEGQPWSRAMAACGQDKGWHAEGDVWTHTKMVCAQLQHLEEWPSLTGHEQTLLIFTALFHDAAKPLTTTVDPHTGRTTSPKHAVKGEHLARSILRELNCDLTTREEICRLVRFHGRPTFLLEKSNPNHEVISLSWLINNRLLFLFALADTRGRTTESMTRPEENLQFWKLAAEENGCFSEPYRFENDHARFLFFRQSEPNLHYVPQEEYSCTVTLMSGLPGAGKDTWLSRERSETPVVSLDAVREEFDVDPTANQGEVVQAAQDRCRKFLRAGVSFAFNATNLMRQLRQRWVNLFADYGARIELVYVEPAFETILRRNRQRERQVPEKVIRRLAQKCEPPTLCEAHAVELCDR